MTRVVTPVRVRLAWGLLALVTVAAGLEGRRLAEIDRRNDAIAQMAAGPAPVPADDPAAPPALRLAWANRVAADAATSAAADQALQRLRALQGDDAVGQAARYNAANLLMRRAMQLTAGPDGEARAGQALPLFELAKALYRDVLRADPSHDAARYNLERAQRLLPDPEAVEPVMTEAPRAAERAATTMRGNSMGLP